MGDFRAYLFYVRDTVGRSQPITTIKFAMKFRPLAPEYKEHRRTVGGSFFLKVALSKQTPSQKTAPGISKQ